MREEQTPGAETPMYVRSLRKTLIVLALSVSLLLSCLSSLHPPCFFPSSFLSFFPQGRTALAVVEEKLSSVAEVGQRYDLADEHQAIRDFLRGRRSEEGGGGGSRTHMTVVREHS